ncbi:MAG: hypothetical protein LBU51_03525 [Bacteroidales bacterium]|jgi:hypothetical protein|nr:hypothetical protein [Bacteroidales bacterium]
MKNTIQNLILAALCVVSITTLKAEKFKGAPSHYVPKAEAQCLASSNSNELDLNNVRAYIQTNGKMWSKEIAEYEVPKGSGKTPMFSASLWIGGRDISGQLKLAAVRFNQLGEDYWTGPLSKTDASIPKSECLKWDKHYKIHRVDVEDFIYWSEHDGVGPYEGYQVPRVIQEWPAHPYFDLPGDWNPGSPIATPNGQSAYLAPFKDVDGDGIYDWRKGDYPYYDLTNALCPWTPDNIQRAAAGLLPKPPEDPQGVMGMIYSDHVLKGDQTLYWIFNDMGNQHTESGGKQIGLEFRGQAFCFATNDELNNMTFYSYEIINRSSFRLLQTFFSQWVDPDLGYARDDYVGCDVARGLGFCYNGTETDGTGQLWAYGIQPPAVGVDFFQGPYIDPDGRDNPKFYLDSALLLGDMYCSRFLNTPQYADQNDRLAINGVNFGDGIVDNERFGMRRFVYHNNASTPTGDPESSEEYYLLLRGFWKDGTRMHYGGNGHPSFGTNHANGPECDFMFPGTTDPCNWGTNGIDPVLSQYGNGGWTEENMQNPPEDRRFMQSAGPFTLEAGAVNYITVGIPWARASSGGPYASVELLKVADDKCQTLFENCFKILDGPDAPDVTFVELENELILLMVNSGSGNNPYEDYAEISTSIPEHFTGDTTTLDRYYRFEGYMIYQLKDKNVSVTDLNDLNKARLIAQCDLKNFKANGQPIGRLVNWIYSEKIQTVVATEMVDGANNGLFHSLSIKEDAFATANKTLVNHKNYYYMVLAYAYNEYFPFSLDQDGSGLKGQQTPFLAGRKNVRSYVGIPHKPMPQNGIIDLQSAYGDQPEISRIEGQGNGGFYLDLTDESREQILKENSVQVLKYKKNAGPLAVKVIDPIKVQPYDYFIKIKDAGNKDVTDTSYWELEIKDHDLDPVALKALGFNSDGKLTSSSSIAIENEQLLLELGISIALYDKVFEISDNEARKYAENFCPPAFRGYTWVNLFKYGSPLMLGSSKTYANPDKPWLGGVIDNDSDSPGNWIRSGTNNAGLWHGIGENLVYNTYGKWRTEDCFEYISYTRPGETSADEYRGFKDPQQQFEKVIDGTWAPYVLSSPYWCGPKACYVTPDTNYTVMDNSAAPTPSYFDFKIMNAAASHPAYSSTLTNLYSVDIIMTNDKSKWTRCVVLEACDDASLSEGGALAHEPRKHKSVDKNGNTSSSDQPSTNEDDPNFISAYGMGWFPGYAINIETGERLNIMFAENSSDVLNHGNDMLFNPTNTYGKITTMRPDGTTEDLVVSDEVYNNYVSSGLYNNRNNWFYLNDGSRIKASKPEWGGRHFVYVCGSSGNTCSAPYFASAKLSMFLYERNFDANGVKYPSQAADYGDFIPDVLDNSKHLPYFECGPYDNGRWLISKFNTFVGKPITDVKNRKQKMQLFNNVMWTSIPMSLDRREDAWLDNDATIKLRVSRPYLRYNSRWYQNPNDAPQNETLQNGGFPMYEFSTKNLAPVTNANYLVQSVLDEINVVPNPYYAFSTYETTTLENYVKIVNLPDNCDISIYTVNGILVKKFSKDTHGITYQTWDLKNDAGIPIAGGMYLIYVKVRDPHDAKKVVGERTLKFFCAMRPVDLNAF